MIIERGKKRRRSRELLFPGPIPLLGDSRKHDLQSQHASECNFWAKEHLTTELCLIFVAEG